MAQCRLMLRKKLKPDPVTQPAKELKPKLYRYLLGRGYSPAIISSVLERTLKEINRQ